MVYNDNYVLLEVYSPQCAHCKILAPIYEDLAKKLEDEIDITIAKFDATQNEHAAIKTTSYPTILLFKPGSEEAIEFEK